MMRRIFLCWLALGLGAASLCADETVRTIQSHLKAGGFYSGEVNGAYNSDTAAAITRYQIRNGLQITGKLDSQTKAALGVTSPAVEKIPTPKLGEDVWRYLRKSDQEHIKRLMAEEPRPPSQPSKSPALSETTPSATAAALTRKYDRERLRDYIAAFVLAGLDPQVGSEAEFFADRVDYFGVRNVSREKIRRDLQSYDNRWPERRFWLAGELDVTPINGQLKVSFPLRYELQRASRRSSGQVWKTLILQETRGDDLEIVSVNERKAR